MHPGRRMIEVDGVCSKANLRHLSLCSGTVKTVPYRLFYYMHPSHKCSVGRDALIPPRRNLVGSCSACKIFVGDDACHRPAGWTVFRGGDVPPSPLLTNYWMQCNLFSTLPHRTVIANLCFRFRRIMPHYVSFHLQSNRVSVWSSNPGPLLICAYSSAIIKYSVGNGLDRSEILPCIS